MITKSVAVEYAKDNIRANCLCPGGVRTPMVADFFDDEFLNDEQAQRAYQPLGLIDPEEVADVAVFLVSDESRKMTGSAVVVDAGYTASRPSRLGRVDEGGPDLAHRREGLSRFVNCSDVPPWDSTVGKLLRSLDRTHRRMWRITDPLRSFLAMTIDAQQAFGAQDD